MILLVDDEVQLREVLSFFLQEEGFKIAEVGDGAEALDYLRSHKPPALVLLDLMMPKMGGQEFRENQLRDSQISSVPVAIMSAGRLTSDQIQKLKPQALVEKPFDLDRLLDTVKLYSRRRSPLT